MQHHVLLAVSHPITAAEVTQFSVVRVDGAYTTASPILGVTLEDGVSGEKGPIAVQGLLPVEIATGENLAVGDILGLDTTGKGVAPSSGNKVSDFTTVIEINQGHALVVL